MNVENSFSYKGEIYKNWEFEHLVQTKLDKDEIFDQKNKISNLKWIITRKHKKFYNSLVFEYDYSYEEGFPNEQKYAFKKKERKAGFVFGIKDLYNLNFRTQFDYSYLNDHTSQQTDIKKNSDGCINLTSLNFSKKIGIAKIDMNSVISSSNVRYRQFQKYDAKLAMSIDNDEHKIKTNFSFKKNKNSIYNLYTYSDKKKRENYNLDFRYSTSILKMMNVKLLSSFDHLINRFKESSAKNFKSRMNSVELKAEIPIGNYSFIIDGERQFTDKDFIKNENSAEIDYKAFSSAVKYQFSNRDSIVIKRLLDIKRTDMPYSKLKSDNDELNDKISTGLYWYIYNRMHIKCVYSYDELERIYVFKDMSGENNTKKNHNLEPSVEMILFDRIVFFQSYQLRANYEDYQWNERRKDRFLRRILISYALSYDETPGYESSSTVSWTHLKQGIKEAYPLVFSVRYEYIKSEFGNKEGDAYQISNEEEQHNLIVTIKKMYKDFQFSSYSNATLTNDKELNQVFEIVYYLPNRAELKSTINPIWQDRYTVDWKVNFDISIKF